MNIPPSFQTWAQAMRAGVDGEPEILTNLERETCLPHLEADFFAALAGANPTTPQEAQRANLQVVKDGWNTLTCQGNAADPGRFARLLRLSKATSSFRYHVPESERPRILDDRGLDASALDGATRAEWEILLDEYDAPVKVSGQLHLAWVADHAEVAVPALPNRATLEDRLGLRGFPAVPFVVMFTYARASLPENLRVPRAFDGVDNPQFQLEADCAARAGRTRPLTAAGLPGAAEAVHRGAVLPAGHLPCNFCHDLRRTGPPDGHRPPLAAAR